MNVPIGVDHSNRELIPIRQGPEDDLTTLLTSEPVEVLMQRPIRAVNDDRELQRLFHTVEATT